MLVGKQNENLAEEEVDANLEAEGLEEGVEEELEEQVEEGEDASTEEVEDPDAPVVFDKKQQDEINGIIKARLDRQDAKLVKDLSKAAGVDISHDELAPAARLWGLLKSNPNLSKEIDAYIAASISKGEAVAPDAKSSGKDAVTQRLELKEAILDLKAADPTFSKNAEKILTWADNEGYEVTDAKALKLAYLAWKGSQGKVAEAIQKTTAQRKQATKQQLQKRATVQGAKPGATHVNKTDYSKMTDESVLASEGLSLFTKD